MNETNIPPGAGMPARILLGPGPSELEPRAASALAAPAIGYLDPALLAALDETRELLRRVWNTSNALTGPLWCTGTGGMETALANVVEPGDRVVAGVHGLFGGRIAEGARRLGAEVTTVESDWGRPLDAAAMVAAIRRVRPAIVSLVHAETSTGVLLRDEVMRDIAGAAREAEALFLVDCVTSLGGAPVSPDGWPADVCFSAGQKSLSGPTGCATVTFSDRARARRMARRTPPPTFNFDIALIEGYWTQRSYHHTCSSNLLLALREALRAALEEGLPARFARHGSVSEALAAGLGALGLELLVAPGDRLPMLTPVKVPAGVDAAAIRNALLERDGIEIGVGFGPLAGKIWRIGLMGRSCRWENVVALLKALGGHLGAAGFHCSVREAVAACGSPQ